MARRRKTTMTHGRAQALSRREALGIFGATGVVLLGGCGDKMGTEGGTFTSGCTLTPEQGEGPFYVDEGLLRSDITDGQTGVPLRLGITVVKASTCQPIANAAVDVWSANRNGVYSDESQEGTTGQKFLRGVQLTDSSGNVQFTTVYPGWYPGRTCHVHVKVRIGGTTSVDTYASGGSRSVHGGQMFFPSAFNAALRSVYTENTNTFINNDDDGVYTLQGGAASLLTLSGSLAAGFSAGITLAVNA
jgi:protocatechuate 3,4-dioxygenase beta subunit